MPRRKNPEDRTPQEEIASVVKWAEQVGYADVPVIAALRDEPTRGAILAAIQSADQHDFRNIAAALRARALR